MKKIFLLIILCLLLCPCSVYSKEKNEYYIKHSGYKYRLLYSAKDKEFNGYVNEYFKRGETYYTWSDMLAVHHFPNVYSPISQVKMFKDYLSSMNCPCAVTFDDKNNSAIIDFILINDSHAPIILEFNVFKFQKSRKSGSVALQYAKRYSVRNTLQQEEVMKEFAKYRKKAVNNLKNDRIPNVVEINIDKCKTAKEEEKVIEEKADVRELQDEPSDKNSGGTEINEESLNEKEISTDENEKLDDTEVKADSDNFIENETNQNVNIEYKPENEKSEKSEIKQKDENFSKENIEKSENYKVINNKDEFYAKPRTKKEIMAEHKKVTKRDLKKRAKKAQKNLSSNK